jgi:hypothetical protein
VGKEDLEFTLTTTGRGNPEDDTCAQWGRKIWNSPSQPPAEETLRMILVLSGKEDLEMTLTTTGRGNPENDTCAHWEGRPGIDPDNWQRKP